MVHVQLPWVLKKVKTLNAKCEKKENPYPTSIHLTSEQQSQ